MFGYVNGQKYARIVGDQGCTLKGVLDGFKNDGCPEEKYAEYTGAYYTRFTEEARQNAKQYKLLSYAPITSVEQLYEGLAKRVGAAYFGMCWTGEFKNPQAGGLVNSYREQQGAGYHAVCFLDWSTQRDRSGYPRLKLFNSHGEQYGDKGKSHWSYDAVRAAIESPNTSAFFLSDMAFMKPRFDWANAKWTI